MEGIFESMGFEIRKESLSRMASCKRLVRWLRMKSEGMWCLEVVCRIFLKQPSPAEHKLGRDSFRKLISVSAVKSTHLGGGGGLGKIASEGVVDLERVQSVGFLSKRSSLNLEFTE